MYSLTKAGELFLSGWIDVLQNYQAVLEKAAKGFLPRRTTQPTRLRGSASWSGSTPSATSRTGSARLVDLVAAGDAIYLQSHSPNRGWRSVRYDC